MPIDPLNEYALPVFGSAIAQRQVYAQTASEGLTVFDADNPKARAEVASLLDDVLEILVPSAREVA